MLGCKCFKGAHILPCEFCHEHGRVKMAPKCLLQIQKDREEALHLIRQEQKDRKEWTFAQAFAAEEEAARRQQEALENDEWEYSRLPR